MYQKWVGIGRLTKDPELRNTPEGTPVARFTMAIDRPVKKKEGDKKNDADFIDVIVWRNKAENVAKYRKKGDPVAVEGRLQIRSYEDKEGVRRKAAEIVASSVVFLPNGKKSSVEDSPWPEDEYAGGGKADSDPFEDVPFSEDDIPF